MAYPTSQSVRLTNQPALVQQRTVGHTAYLSNIKDDEIPLSPASRNILEKCAVSAAPALSSKDARAMPTVISRPPSSVPDLTGFHFTKPNRPIPSFSARSHPKPTAISPTIVRDLDAQKGGILGGDISNIKDTKS